MQRKNVEQFASSTQENNDFEAPFATRCRIYKRLSTEVDKVLNITLKLH